MDAVCVPVSASRVISCAAALGSPVHAASNSIASNASRLRTITVKTYPVTRASNAESRPAWSMPDPLQSVPEAAAQGVPHLVVQQRIDGQRRVLQQPGFEV